MKQLKVCQIDDTEAYKKAMKMLEVKNIEVSSLRWNKMHHKNNFCVYCDLHPGRKVIKSRWIFKTKYKINHKIEKFKVCLVTKRCFQKYSIDYEEFLIHCKTYSSIYFLICLVTSNSDLDPDQMYIVTAFLNLNYVWSCILICSTMKNFSVIITTFKYISIYGLKKGSHCWYLQLGQNLKEIGL